MFYARKADVIVTSNTPKTYISDIEAYPVLKKQVEQVSVVNSHFCGLKWLVVEYFCELCRLGNASWWTTTYHYDSGLFWSFGAMKKIS